MWRGERQETRNILLAPLGQGRGKGSPSISQRQTAKEASLGRTQDQEREQGLEKGTQRRGKECHTNTASCKQELDPLELHCQPLAPLQAACWGRREGAVPSPGLPHRTAAGWSVLQPQAGAVPTESANRPPTWGVFTPSPKHQVNMPERGPSSICPP